MDLRKNNSGQATVEYVLIFSFLFLIAISLVKTITGFMEDTSAKMAAVLSQQLSSGYCKSGCVGDAYGNSILP